MCLKLVVQSSSHDRNSDIAQQQFSILSDKARSAALSPGLIFGQSSTDDGFDYYGALSKSVL